jgi:hypothetical protein
MNDPIWASQGEWEEAMRRSLSKAKNPVDNPLAAIRLENENLRRYIKRSHIAIGLYAAEMYGNEMKSHGETVTAEELQAFAEKTVKVLEESFEWALEQ